MASLQFAAEEKKLITDRLKELDTLEREQNLFLKQQNLKQKELTARKLEILTQLDSVYSRIDECLGRKPSLLEAQAKKDNDRGDLMECLETQKAEMRQKITDLQQKIDRDENQHCPTGLLNNSDCTVCIQSLAPPKQIFQCKEGHLICNSCLDQLSTPDKCPTCSFVGYFSRNRALEDLHREVASEETPSLKEKMSELLDVLIVETMECFAKVENDCKQNTEISDVEQELTTLRSEESDLLDRLEALESELTTLTKEKSSLIAQQEENKIMTVKELQTVRRAMLDSFLTTGYLQTLKNSGQEDVRKTVTTISTVAEPLLKDLDWKEGEHYTWATHIVTMSITIDGAPIPDIQIFLTGKESPHTVEKFLKLCDTLYKDSKIHYVWRGGVINGGRFSSTGQELEYTGTHSPDTKRAGDWRVGDVGMDHSPTVGTWWNSWFGFDLNGGGWTDDNVRVGRVLDTSPGSGLREIERRAKYDSDDDGTVSNNIIVKNITATSLSAPIIIPV